MVGLPLDQMIRKGDLQDIDAFIGSKHGKYRTTGDTYLTNEPLALTPAIVTKDISGGIINKITFDDIANSINSNFNQYNYNSAYASDCYAYDPINEDKFLNYLNYYWIPEMPDIEVTMMVPEILLVTIKNVFVLLITVQLLLLV